MSQQNKFVKQHTINIEHMRQKQEYFGETLEICEEFGLIPFMYFKFNFDDALVEQFFSVVHFDNDDARTITWMTKDKRMSSPW
jgi:hypothetical protein